MIGTMYSRPRSPLIWLPLVLGGSVLYWTLAFGLGGMSLSFLSGSSQEELELDVPATAVTDTEEPIVVHLEEPIMVRLQTLSEARAAGVVIEPKAEEPVDLDAMVGVQVTQKQIDLAAERDEPVTPSPQPGEDTVGQTAF
jgi:hypothetical protein